MNLLLLFFFYAFFASINGTPDSVIVTDGDTIMLRGQVIRLYGIDAPELKQTCITTDDKIINCGDQARKYLQDAIQELPRTTIITCSTVDIDRYRRKVAICQVRISDVMVVVLNEAMVRAGWALDYSRYSGGLYAEAESEARKFKAGLWAFKTFERPEDYRRRAK